MLSYPITTSLCYRWTTVKVLEKVLSIKSIKNSQYFLVTVRSKFHSLFYFHLQEAEAIGFGPFPASGLFKLLYHPNGTSVVLASMQMVIVAAQEEATNMLSLEGWLKKDADVKFVPKKAYFRIIQQRQGSDIFVLQSEINPSAFMEVIFEPRHVFF